MDPYGDDDADFELNFLLDRHTQVIDYILNLYNSLILINFKYDIRLGTNDLFDIHPCADTDEPSPIPLIPNGIHNHRP